MKSKNYKSILLFLAGLIISVANAKLWILFSCLGLIPLFVIISKTSKKEALLSGFVFGIGVGFGLFFWMIKGVSIYTGNSMSFGVLITLISTALIGLYFGILCWITAFFWITNATSKYKLLFNRLCIAAIWALSEFLLSNFLEAFPLHNIRLGLSFVSNLFFIQLTSFGGLLLLSFLTVLINLLLAEFYITKNRKYLFTSVTLLTVMLLFGALSYNVFSPNKIGQLIKVAIVADNSDPKTKWNTENGNELAKKYFKLCEQAASKHPDFIIWPETALPWTYSKDDDLLNEMVNISRNQKLTHVIGINNESISTKKLYNSVFYIDTKNQVNGIYNKQILLKGIEQPLGDFVVPFLSQEGFVLSNGENQKPIQTNFGKAGNLVCNEVVVEKCGAKQVENGANFFFNLSNDGWFKDIYISDLHFYYARLQAVENRKDICIANNCGINGIISSDGNIVSEKKESKSTLISGFIQPNNNVSFLSKYPNLFPFLFVLIILINILINYKQFKNQY